jgi:hypothetical protein
MGFNQDKRRRVVRIRKDWIQKIGRVRYQFRQEKRLGSV